MTDRERLEIYDRNQRRLIKALTKAIKEKKELEKRSYELMWQLIYYGTFLTDEQKNAAQMLADATTKKVMQE